MYSTTRSSSLRPSRPSRSSELRLPRVPFTEHARAAVWCVLGLTVLAGARTPAAPPAVAFVAGSEGCELDWAGVRPACACERLSGWQRRLVGWPIPLNRATSGDLQALPGIGPARARAIVTERERRGPFDPLDELVRVPGIGPATVARLRTLVRVDGPDPACAARGGPIWPRR